MTATTPKRVDLLDPDHVASVAAEVEARAKAGFDPLTASNEDCERAIIGKLVGDALAKGYVVSVNDGGAWVVKRSHQIDDVMGAIMTTDEDVLLFRDAEDQRLGVVCLVYGNAPWEVIADYTDKPAIRDLLAGAEELARQIEEVRA